METLDIDDLDEFDDEDRSTSMIRLGGDLTSQTSGPRGPYAKLGQIGFMMFIPWAGCMMFMQGRKRRRARMVFELPCDLHPDALVQRLYEWLQLVGLFFALHRNGMALGEASMTAGVVPLTLCHLALAVLGLICTDKEWAVSLEMGSWIAFEPAISIEGLAFDVFGKSELLARQASSTLLAVFTFACALGVTIGGFIYDLAGWRGMSVFHVVCQSSMVFLFATQPSTLISFREFFHRSDPLVDDSDDSGLHTVVPATPANPATSAAGPAVRGTPPASHREDLVVEEVADSVPELPGTVDEASGVASGEVGEVGAVCSGMRQSAVSCVSQNSHRSTVERRSWRGPHLRHSVTSAASRLTKQTMKSHKSFHTVNTKGSKGTQGTFLSKVTGVTNLKDSENLEHTFLANNALRPTVQTTRAGEPRGDEAEDKKTKGIPKDLRIPALLIVMCCLNNNLSYVLEFSTFAIFFKEYHGWNSALWASLAQSAGDLTAAIMMKLLGAATDDDEEAGILRRLTKQPYSLSCLLFIWLLCNLGMTSPWLPLAVTAQVIMGTVYVYTSKLTTDLNLFYSLGDQSLFLHLQVWCKNVEALGGCAASFLGPLLFEAVSPFFPFFVSATFSTVTFILFTSGFCQRLGFPPDVETAEAQRSRRLGLRRVSHWSVVSRKSHHNLEQVE
ncbi:Uncharacterized protein SCF082_LOCUS14077 [Durusdinium trenchii]|uniref:Solute carrier family 40 protein n=1 Tax=Durusdinium trenchii TaxID=1381693 RepID=A0ABP0JVA0_9DINO